MRLMLVEHPSRELDKHLHRVSHHAGNVIDSHPPVLLIQFQQTLGFGFLSGEIGKPIDYLLPLFFPLFTYLRMTKTCAIPAHSFLNHSFICVLVQISRTSSRPCPF